jgi:ABC-type Mn2+/Zn2+ transport system ATPase subunit
MDTSTNSLIRLEGVDLGYPHRPRVLRGVDFAIREGGFLGIVGANGAGKSTLLKAILGLLRPQRGTITVAGGDLRPGYVPQRQALDPLYPLRVIDVVIMGLYRELGPGRRPGRAAWARAERALEEVGFAERARDLFRDLSGGQQQRTLIARALVPEPRILALDEPTNGLDLVGETGIMDLVAGLHRQGRTVLLVSHLLNVVANYAEELAILHAGTIEAGPIETMLTAERLGRLYGVPVDVETTRGQRVVLPRRPAAAGATGQDHAPAAGGLPE